MDCMLSFQLDSLPSKDLDKDVFVSLVHGSELTLNYFELKNENVKIPFHEHPVEHLVVVLKGAMKFLFEDKNIFLKQKDCLFVPAKTRHTARVLEGPVKALEIYPVIEDDYYSRYGAASNTLTEVE
jgi:mannose-6-phosphate isomerase-like protein (cupin superfamily)